MNRNNKKILCLFIILMVFIRPVGAESLDKTAAPEEKMVKVPPETPQEGIPLADKNDHVAVIPSQDKNLINVNFINLDIREALSAISMQQEINIVPAQEISGKISVHLYQSTLDKALEAIAMAGGCVCQKRGDLYYIYKPKETLDPLAGRLQVRMFKLNYAEIENIQEIITAIPGMRLVKIHMPSKSVMVEDTPENIEKIATIINYWDIKPRQVLIAAKILEVELKDDMAMGVDWEAILGNVRLGTGGFSSAVMPVAGGESVSPVPESGTGLFGNVITGNFTAALDALQNKTRVNTLSTPKILAIHGKPAKVQVGGEQGYSVTTVSNGIAVESIEFIQTGTILEITPYINDNGTILLKVQPSIRSATLEEGIPVVRTTEASTWLMAKNGDTVFIAGLIQNSKIMTSKKVPLLGDIPGLGVFFSRVFRDGGKSELVILIKPQIFNEDQEILEQETIERTKKTEQDLQKEPIPDHSQFIELLSPGKMK